MSIEDTNIEKLADMLDKHKEACFHKSTCVICKAECTWHDISQCDICGIGFNVQYDEHKTYKCNCSMANIINVCEGCYDINPFEIVKELDDKYYDIYLDNCCPLTKKANVN